MFAGTQKSKSEMYISFEPAFLSVGIHLAEILATDAKVYM